MCLLSVGLKGGDGCESHLAIHLQEVQVTGMGGAQRTGAALAAGRPEPGSSVLDRIVEGLQMRVRAECDEPSAPAVLRRRLAASWPLRVSWLSGSQPADYLTVVYMGRLMYT